MNHISAQFGNEAARIGGIGSVRLASTSLSLALLRLLP
jgi:hypothetical protein